MRSHLCATFFAVLFSCGVALAADEGGHAVAVGKAIEAHIGNKQIAGAVAIIADREQTLVLTAQGEADVAGHKPMRPDTIFAVASMTKPVTATAVLMLYGQGKLSIDDPIGKYVPELAHLKTADGVEHVVTLRQLLSHTSGLGEAPRGSTAGVRTLAELIPLFASQPLQFEPGSQWKYCQSGINTMARVVEVVSGESYPDYLEAHLFGPLKLVDTTFYPAPAQVERIATFYKRVKGELEVAQTPFVTGHHPAARDYYPAANGGLFSTGPEYARFCQMILRGGEWGGHRFLSAEAVKLMTTLATGEKKAGWLAGEGYGLGWLVARQPADAERFLTPGSFGHGGAWGTTAWIDPAKDRVYVLMIQRDDFNNNEAGNTRNVFTEAATK